MYTEKPKSEDRQTITTELQSLKGMIEDLDKLVDTLKSELSPILAREIVEHNEMVGYRAEGKLVKAIGQSGQESDIVLGILYAKDAIREIVNKIGTIRERARV